MAGLLLYRCPIGGATIAIGTNLPSSKWGSVFPDPCLVATIVDRVTFNAHILETGTQSWRSPGGPHQQDNGRVRGRKIA